MNDQELFGEFANLPPLGYTEAPDWTWKRHRLELRAHVARGDNIREFTRWSTVYATMFVGETKTSGQIMRDLIAEKDFKTRWKAAITENELGCPERMNRYPYTSANLVRQAYDLLQFEKETGIKTEKLRCIVEFGAGYGAMSAIIRRLGFTGEYCTFDLPEFSLLQRYYLSNLGFEVTTKEVDDHDRFQIPPSNVDLLIACYSLSEVDPLLREAFFHVVKPKYALIATQEQYKDWDLHEQFTNMAVRHDEYTWAFRENKYMVGFRYIVATRKEGQ